MADCKGHTSCSGGCDIAPCFRCGWMCPNSTWTFRKAVDEAVGAYEEAVKRARDADSARYRREKH